MVFVLIREEESRTSVRITGHAGVKTVGQADLVCCAVSTLVMSFRLSCEVLTPSHFSVVEGAKPGYFEASLLKKGETEKTLVASLILGLVQLQKDYPDLIKVTLEDKNGT